MLVFLKISAVAVTAIIPVFELVLFATQMKTYSCCTSCQTLGLDLIMILGQFQYPYNVAKALTYLLIVSVAQKHALTHD